MNFREYRITARHAKWKACSTNWFNHDFGMAYIRSNYWPILQISENFDRVVNSYIFCSVAHRQISN